MNNSAMNNSAMNNSAMNNSAMNNSAMKLRTLMATLFAVLAISSVGCDWFTSKVEINACPRAEPINCLLRLELPPRFKLGEVQAEILAGYYDESQQPENQSIKFANIQIINRGKQRVTLVMPGDGSDCFWRTPCTGWSILPLDSDQEHPQSGEFNGTAGGRCGNINSLSNRELFVLRPGQSKNVNQQIVKGISARWASFRQYLISRPNVVPGKYRVVFYYTNQPGLKWRGASQHDPQAMNRVQNSTPVTLRSNEVIVEIVK